MSRVLVLIFLSDYVSGGVILGGSAPREGSAARAVGAQLTASPPSPLTHRVRFLEAPRSALLVGKGQLRLLNEQ